MSSFCICKSYSHFFSAKNICELDIVLTRTVNILTTNELVKLTLLWTTGPWMILWTCAGWSEALFALRCQYEYFILQLPSCILTADIKKCLLLEQCIVRLIMWSNPGPAEPRYALPLQTVKIQISWLLFVKFLNSLKMDLHCLYQQPGSSNLNGWKSEVAVPS